MPHLQRDQEIDGTGVGSEPPCLYWHGTESRGRSGVGRLLLLGGEATDCLSVILQFPESGTQVKLRHTTSAFPQ